MGLTVGVVDGKMNGDHAGVLPNLSALSLDAQWGKEKKPKPTPYGKDGKKPVIILREDKNGEDGALRTVTLSDGTVMQLSTFQPGDYKFKGKLSQKETKYLQDTYGRDWSASIQADKMRNQAREVLSQRLLPLMQQKLDELNTTEKVNDATAAFMEKHYEPHFGDDKPVPKLDFEQEVMPFLIEEWGPNWNKFDDGRPFNQKRIDGMVFAGSELLREKKGAQLEEELQQLRADLYLYEKREATKLFENFHYDEAAQTRRKAHALLRHWFNRRGMNKGSMRNWYTMNELPPERAKKMKQLREAWATSEVRKETYNPANPPRPPLTYGTDNDPYNLMYSKGHDVYYNDSYLRDDVDKISEKGGQWVWHYMRALEAANFEAMDPMPKDKLLSMDIGLKYWDANHRKHQKQQLTLWYKEFITSVDVLSGVEDATGVAYSYTAGSGKFNRYLRWPSTLVDGDPSKIPTYGVGQADAMGYKFYGYVGPPDLLHRLYKLVNRCPRLTDDAVFLRAVRNVSGLPHNLGKSPPFAEPEIGKRYLNVTFMSTSSAAPSNYMTGNLSSFYDKENRCCMYVITAPSGTAVLPLVLGGKTNSQFPDEQEVVLPPGLLLVFQGTQLLNVNNDGSLSKVYFYQVFPPGDVTMPRA